ncbi:MAG: hypothetical protein H6R08_1948 [Proteobacteria bacterium]|nr:hypothetical protein [Pseudomonadota bacterium]
MAAPWLGDMEDRAQAAQNLSIPKPGQAAYQSTAT